MSSLDYNRSFPCPTDMQILPIYKRYRELKKEAVASWKTGATRGLLEAREFRDFDDCRLDMVRTSSGFTPVVSFKPIIKDLLDSQLEKHATFLTAYSGYRDAIIVLINVVLHHTEPDIQETQRLKSQIVCTINYLEILISLMENGFFTTDYGERILSGGSPEVLLQEAKKLTGKWDYPQLSTLEDMRKGYNHTLIGAFYHHVRCLHEADEISPHYG